MSEGVELIASHSIDPWLFGKAGGRRFHDPGLSSWSGPEWADWSSEMGGEVTMTFFKTGLAECITVRPSKHVMGRLEVHVSRGVVHCDNTSYYVVTGRGYDKKDHKKGDPLDPDSIFGVKELENKERKGFVTTRFTSVEGFKQRFVEKKLEDSQATVSDLTETDLKEAEERWGGAIWQEYFSKRKSVFEFLNSLKGKKVTYTVRQGDPRDPPFSTDTTISFLSNQRVEVFKVTTCEGCPDWGELEGVRGTLEVSWRDVHLAPAVVARHYRRYRQKFGKEEASREDKEKLFGTAENWVGKEMCNNPANIRGSAFEITAYEVCALETLENSSDLVWEEVGKEEMECDW
uniref:Uncharacterized protein n=1 Tax=Chromera velia CCMP2878 TaxID=1169474 RepID=A0A0G4IFU9_9ALVE|eukprot:Cvel_14023.t1-p1 / transcript=Cvel_14023.t1 / gene=Cvel_14023 / organism=Chromera_velia_CCMP2878 / gene_product=hypothetical protein / transcript_product=hypothetical protein / location=Cvel_scaffold982:2037-3071(-) / protein_length=345 / sequence_SO=supercontig / SO=protein_coding / is_pseudo=false